jgi:hypothetical protein
MGKKTYLDPVFCHISMALWRPVRRKIVPYLGSRRAESESTESLAEGAMVERQRGGRSAAIIDDNGISWI